MKLLAKTFPFVLFQLGYGQTPNNQSGKKLEFGSSSSTFVGSSVNYISSHFLEKENVYSYLPLSKPNATFTNFGWKQGMFIWVNLTKCISYKTQIDIVFGVNQYHNIPDAQNTYGKFLGLEYKPQLVIKLGCCNKDPVIKLAPNMSYYLNQRQTYLIVGPTCNFRKSDRDLVMNRSEKRTSVGGVVGFGIDNLFPNLDVAPEILLSVEYLTNNQNQEQKSSNRFYTSLSLAINFF